MRKINVLVACEESQAVCIEFRKMGFNAYSCDLVECSGGHSEWHILGDCKTALTKKPIQKFFWFVTQDKHIHCVDRWDLVIAHPPCTYLCITGNRWYNVERYGKKAIQRMRERERESGSVLPFLPRYPLRSCRDRKPHWDNVNAISETRPNYPALGVWARMHKSNVPLVKGIAYPASNRNRFKG